MKKYGYLAAVLAAFLYVSPVMASNSVELSTERGTDTEVRGYFGGDRSSMVPQSYPDSVRLSSERGFAGSDVRGYFSSDGSVESSLDLSRENGAS